MSPLSPSKVPSSVQPTSSSAEPTALAGITAAHNNARSNVNPAAVTPLPALTWDSTVASHAQTCAHGCVYAHGGHVNEGQNLYAAAGTVPTGQSAITSWVDNEVPYYTYSTNTCQAGKVCGHYTQVVWASTTKLGCGFKTCTTGSPFGASYPTWHYIVCNYSPPGNYIGEWPYQAFLAK